MTEEIIPPDQPENTQPAADDYTPESIQHLQNADHIRRRPGMYIGDTGPNGLHHLVYELVYNSVDEALAGFCKNIHVTIGVDGSLSVSDDGRGIPVDPHPETGRSTLEMVLTKTGTGAKFDKGTYKTSTGLHGMGLKAVTALSEWVEAQVRRNGRVYIQEYERGRPSTEVTDNGSAGARTGTLIKFNPDPEIFHEATFDAETLENRLRELAFLHKGLVIKLTDERTGKEETFKYDGGLAEFVEYLNRSEDVLHKPIYVDRTVENVRVEAAIQYTGGEEDRTRCYTNGAYNPVGGTHMSGFRGALTRALNAYGNKEQMFKNNLAPIGEDLREGMTAVLSVQVPEPQFESNNKLRLNNPEVEGIVSSVIHEQLTRYMEENPKDALKIMKKVILAAEVREAAAKAKKALIDRKKILGGGGLPGKLYDCTTRNREESELFLVEGQSAGGSAESGRDRMFQAILPLRGKVLNVEKAAAEKVLSNDEICNLISAVGVDIGESETPLEKLRYDKVIILTDADVDGRHISTLLLTFFYRQMRKLIETGHVYVARPPLYKVTEKKKVSYVQPGDEEMAKWQRTIVQRGLADTHLIVQREGVQPAATKQFEGPVLEQLVQVLAEMERGLHILERRGLDLATFLKKLGPHGLPVFRVLLSGAEYWFNSDEEVAAFRQEQERQLGRELVVADEQSGLQPKVNGHVSSNNGGLTPTIFKQELHEVRGVNRGLDKLREFGLAANDLLPLPRVAGREPAPRFFLENAGQRRVLPHLRDLLPEVRKLGEKGLSITRFKGLGEMDPEELWDTTLDPKHRTMMRVHLEDALKADEMFRVLMGDKVEPRRKFIEKHAKEVKEIDYHGA